MTSPKWPINLRCPFLVYSRFLVLRVLTQKEYRKLGKRPDFLQNRTDHVRETDNFPICPIPWPFICRNRKTRQVKRNFGSSFLVQKRCPPIVARFIGPTFITDFFFVQIDLDWSLKISGLNAYFYFKLASPWPPEASSSSSLPGVTFTGFSPTKESSTSANISTSLPRSSQSPWKNRPKLSETTDHVEADVLASLLRTLFKFILYLC